MAEVELDQVVIDFPVFGSAHRSMKKTFVRAATGGALARDTADRVVVRALDGINLSIREGERIGLLGHNGSGKSTLLRVIAGAYEPSAGTVAVKGKVAGMLSMFLGMDLEASGLENIYMRGVFMGLTQREIEQQTSDIQEFADLGDYIHMPLRTYSSGMAMRLGFAVSTTVSADILLLDEWLSVGDAEFAVRADVRLRQQISQSKIMVLASHSPDLVRQHCTRIVHLDHGRIASIETV